MNGMDRGYLSWLAQSDAVIEEIVARSVGVSYPGINPLEIGEIKVSLPGVSDQRLIAGYLDIETKRLDGMRAFIRARQKLLEVRLRALIRADLAGYDRDAGPLRRYVTRVKTGATPSPAEAGDVPWYTPASFVDGLTIGAPIRWLPPDWVTDGTAVKFAPDSTLIVGIGATAGRVAHLDHVASGNQQLTCVEPGPRMLSRFLSWQLWAFGDELRGSASVTTLPIISNEVIRSFRVVVPSLDDQAHLVQGWERAATVTKALSQATRRLEGLLDERRRALITASVTGQLQLRGVAA
jgi:type I restriction enzyme S subunit